MAKVDYTKDELIAICERAVVDEKHWRNRDSDHAQRGVGRAWAYLRGNVPYRILTEGDPARDCVTNDRTIWLEFTVKTFGYFECGQKEGETVFLPTPIRLDERQGKDWY